MIRLRVMNPSETRRPIRVKQTLGKYRIERKLGEGGFAAVYRALDTIEGVRVALKIPHDRLVTSEVLDEFRREVRLAASLQHPNILPLKNAEFIGGHFVVAYPLGQRTLADRMQSRMSLSTALQFAEQMLDAVACAHDHRIIHCDIKPDNLILFPDNWLMLTDFGIAKVAFHTVRASGAGTIGYVAPEQAMGRPSFRSDVFSLGLILYRMLCGHLPEWPFEWPPPGHVRLRRSHSQLYDLVRRAIAVDPRKRYRDAGQMLSAFRRALSHGQRRKRKSSRSTAANSRGLVDWRQVQRREFLRKFGKLFGSRCNCHKCDGPVFEPMHFCPWCGTVQKVFRGETNFPLQCPRCSRGIKRDWNYCPWCYGPGFEVETNRQYTDKRYAARCGNTKCPRKVLMPFMRYCPWCRRRVRHRWMLANSKEKCSRCGWGVAGAFWHNCPWCSKQLPTKTRR